MQTRPENSAVPVSPFPAIDESNVPAGPFQQGGGNLRARLVTRLRDTGIRPGMESGLVRNIQVTNLATLVLALLALPYFPILLYLHVNAMAYCVLALIALYASVCLLNLLGYYNVSRICLLTSVNVFILLYAHVLGKESGVLNVYFFSLIGPFMIFHIRETGKLAFLLAQPLVFWTLFHLRLGLGENGLLYSQGQGLFYFCISFTAAIMVMSCTFLIYLSHQKSIVLLSQAKEAAEESSRVKGEFLATMSHEIRTPMNGVLGAIQMIDGSCLPPRQQSYLVMAESSGELLLAILKDILDFSKMEAGRLELEQVELDLQEALAGTLRLLQPEADRCGLRLSLDMDPGCPRMVQGDPVRIRQILLNLGSNAVKFTKQGEVAFGMRKLEEAGDRVQVALSVRDTGIGIPPEKITKIFQAFTQLDSSTTREYGGTGLGLTIARRLALLMGGQLEVESREGEGSTFSLIVWFPLA